MSGGEARVKRSGTRHYRMAGPQRPDAPSPTSRGCELESLTLHSPHVMHPPPVARLNSRACATVSYLRLRE